MFIRCSRLNDPEALVLRELVQISESDAFGFLMTSLLTTLGDVG